MSALAVLYPILAEDYELALSRISSSIFSFSYMTAVVLLGAGASFGSEDVVPHPPPLGNGDNGLFSRLDCASSLASALPDELKAKFRGNFEDGMAAYEEYANGDVTAFQRQLAGYLAQFRPGPSNTYITLLRSLGNQRVIYSSLNYDLLFELSAAALGLNINYNLTKSTNCACLLKLHGSSNFWPAIDPGMFGNIKFSGNKVDVEAPLQVLNRRDTLHRCATDNSFAPAVAMYAKGKPVKVCPSFVNSQQEQWQSAVGSASQVFVVGVRVHPADTHVWEPLANTDASVTYFGRPPDESEFYQWKKSSQKKNAFFLPMSFSQSVHMMKWRLFL